MFYDHEAKIYQDHQNGRIFPRNMADQGDVSIGLQYITGSSKKTAVSSAISPIALVIDVITGIVSSIGNIMFIVATVFVRQQSTIYGVDHGVIVIVIVRPWWL